MQMKFIGEAGAVVRSATRFLPYDWQIEGAGKREWEEGMGRGNGKREWEEGGTGEGPINKRGARTSSQKFIRHEPEMFKTFVIA
ncbi:predicted protein [Sclerotinia sclerotiorum 1980 UF-70]|uniref:Uncharacterized protein n=1 Tax=Sclerotinia sclerotiorum (strain ATCC 18683 / 1980 / Ss-1) TaxID=665079 RepID=A7E985_SCLS1|nr:predicted protein [Sclerotinia sclerotiorum 1980 UF-70]EDN96937.1 predicted protein [Sclerotinia sclerotiorum 1980 UF-70]